MTFSHLSRNNKLIDLEPNNSLQFDDIPNKSSIAYLKIRNVSSENVLFKIKTTAPRSYVVRPNQVVLTPEESIEIQFYMNPVETYPSVLNAKDRFLIAATEVSSNPHDYNASTIWTDKPSSQIQQFKLSAAFKKSVTSIIDNNTSIFNDKKSSTPEHHLPKFQNTPSKSSLQPSLDNIMESENKQQRYSLKDSKVNQSGIKEDAFRSPNVEKLPLKEFHQESFRSSDNKFFEKELSKPNILYTPESSNKYQRNQRSVLGQNQRGGNYQNGLSPGFGTNSNSKLFSGPTGETDTDVDYKKEYERLLSKVEEQEKQLLKASEERSHIFTELENLKNNLNKRKAPLKGAQNIAMDSGGGFQLVHVILVAVISLLLGAFFSV